MHDFNNNNYNDILKCYIYKNKVHANTPFNFALNPNRAWFI